MSAADQRERQLFLPEEIDAGFVQRFGHIDHGRTTKRVDAKAGADGQDVIETAKWNTERSWTSAWLIPSPSLPPSSSQPPLSSKPETNFCENEGPRLGVILRHGLSVVGRQFVQRWRLKRSSSPGVINNGDSLDSIRCDSFTCDSMN